MSEQDATSTISELESRLRELEIKFLGPPSETSGPFAPVSANRSRVERFRVSAGGTSTPSGATEQPKTNPKLPQVKLPSFDGLDLDLFLKDWERWLW